MAPSRLFLLRAESSRLRLLRLGFRIRLGRGPRGRRRLLRRLRALHIGRAAQDRNCPLCSHTIVSPQLPLRPRRRHHLRMRRGWRVIMSRRFLRSGLVTRVARSLRLLHRSPLLFPLTTRIRNLKVPLWNPMMADPILVIAAARAIILEVSPFNNNSPLKGGAIPLRGSARLLLLLLLGVEVVPVRA
jgi:hypothetical protein